MKIKMYFAFSSIKCYILPIEKEVITPKEVFEAPVLACSTKGKTTRTREYRTFGGCPRGSIGNPYTIYKTFEQLKEQKNRL